MRSEEGGVRSEEVAPFSEGGAAEGGGGSKGMKFLNAPRGNGLHALYFAFPFGEGGSPKG